MKNKINLLFAVLFSALAILIIAGCPVPDNGSSKEAGSSGGSPAPSSAKAITAFSFTNALNSAAGVTNDCFGTMIGTNITVTVPFGTTVTGLIATFSTTGASVKIGLTEQTSGMTQNNFSTPKTYIVTAADGTIQNYSVTVNFTVAPPDTTPPANVTDLTVIAGNRQAILNWMPPSDSDFASVEITANPAITTTIVNKGTNTATITGLTNGISYTFRVKSVDTTGNKSTGETAAATPNSFTVIYNGNGNLGGSAPVDTNTYGTNAPVAVLGNTGSLHKTPSAGSAEAFKFGGWNTQADGNGITYAAGNSTFMISSHVTLYAKWVKFELRDTGPAGGLICYDKGSFLSGWRYLEAAPSDQSTGIQWYNGSYITTSASETAIGTGKSNTATIITSQGSGSYAAKLCDNLNIVNNGITYSDWFLPSKDELNLMYINLFNQGAGGFTATYYWTSTEYIYFEAWAQYFPNDYQSSRSKDYTYRVRASRTF